MHEYGLRRTSPPFLPLFLHPSAHSLVTVSLSLSLPFATHGPTRARVGFAGTDWKENCVGKLYPWENPTDNAEFLKRTRREISPPRPRWHRQRRWSSNPAAECLVRRACEFPWETIDGPTWIPSGIPGCTWYLPAISTGNYRNAIVVRIDKAKVWTRPWRRINIILSTVHKNNLTSCDAIYRPK